MISFYTRFEFHRKLIIYFFVKKNVESNSQWTTPVKQLGVTLLRCSKLRAWSTGTRQSRLLSMRIGLPPGLKSDHLTAEAAESKWYAMKL